MKKKSGSPRLLKIGEEESKEEEEKEETQQEEEEIFATAQENMDDITALYGEGEPAWRNKYKITLTDMSMNGTFVNGEKIGKGKKRVLTNGDKICLVRPKGGVEEGYLGYMFKEIRY